MTCTLSLKKLDEGFTSSQLYVSYNRGLNVSAEEMFITSNASLTISKKIMSVQEDTGIYRCRFKDSKEEIYSSHVVTECK